MAFARALATQPHLLLLDEPFAAIDAKVRKELRSWLRDLIKEGEKVNVFLQRIYLVDDAGQTVQIAVNQALREESVVI